MSVKERMAMSASDKQKLHTTVIKGTTFKFQPVVSANQGVEQIVSMENIVNFDSLNKALRKHLKNYTLQDVFFILRFSTDSTLLDPDSKEGTPTFLLESPHLVNEKEVRASCNFYRLRGAPDHIENLLWSFDAVRNSCTSALREIVDAKMNKYDKNEHTGPLYYFFLICQLTSTSGTAVRFVTQSLTTLNKVTDLEGQSIGLMCRNIRSIIKWLQMVDKVPRDLDTIVMQIFKTCTVPQFQQTFKQLPS